jgi:hypothetical protein
MKTLHFSTVINAPRKHVWDIMLGPKPQGMDCRIRQGVLFRRHVDEGQTIRFLIP